MSGRKRSSGVWNFFKYDELTGKSICNLLNKEGSKNFDNDIQTKCEHNISGKNSTNLKQHLKRDHLSFYNDLCKEEEKSKHQKMDASQSQSGATATVNSPHKKDIKSMFLAPKKWDTDSKQYEVRMKALEDMVIQTGIPLHTVNHSQFSKYSLTLDARFDPPGSAKLIKRLSNRWDKMSAMIRSLVTDSKRLILCIDEWSQKNLTHSYLGLSVCFYDHKASISRHVVLNVVEIKRPHTGEKLAQTIHSLLSNWGIKNHQIRLIITDNGSNLVKAIKILKDWDVEDASNAPDNAVPESDSEDDPEVGDAGSDPDDDSEHQDVDETLIQGEEKLEFKRLPCFAHTLQLSLKLILKNNMKVLNKARRLVSTCRRSSLIVEATRQECNLEFLSDNQTRWNSTYRMLQRLLVLKERGISQILGKYSVDNLYSDDWKKVQDICDILQPFAALTDNLQSDALSLSQALPSVVELRGALNSHGTQQHLCKQVADDIKKRFSVIIDVDNPNFNALPAAACLLDIHFAPLLLMEEFESLLQAAKDYIKQEVRLSLKKKKKMPKRHFENLKFSQ